MPKRTIIIIAIAAALILVSVGVIFYLFTGGGRAFIGKVGITPPSLKEQPAQAKLSEERGAAAEPLVAITNEKALFPIVANQNAVRYLARGDSVFQTGLHKNESAEIAGGFLQNIKKIVWKNDAKSFAAWGEKDGQNKVMLVEAATGQSRELFQDISDISWSSDGSSFLALGQNRETSQTFLQRFKADGTSLQTLLTLPALDLNIKWAGQDTVLLWEKPTINSNSVILSFNLKTKSLNVLSQELLSPELVLSAKGDKILVSSFQPERTLNELTLVDLTGKELAKIPVRAMASKCAFSGENLIFCAEPITLGETMQLPEDEWLGLAETQDRLIKYDVLNKKLTELEIPGDAKPHVTQPLITAANDYLIFLDQGDGKLWSLSL